MADTVASQSNSKIHGMVVTNPDGSDILTGVSTSANQNPLDAYSTNFIDEASATLTYICLEDKDGAWCVKKIDTSSGNSFQYATVLNNPTVTSYSDAFTNRATLTYDNFLEAF